MLILAIMFAVVAVLVAVFIGKYNFLVMLKHNVDKAWSNIDVLLKQRHDELPKLVEVCQQYSQFEKTTLAQITEARSRVQQARSTLDLGALGAAEGMLRGGLGQIFAVAEAYPELKANEQFMQLMQRITFLEDAIADRRELYNDTVNVNNIRIEQFPDSILAGMFLFVPRKLLTFEAVELTDVDMKTLFKS